MPARPLFSTLIPRSDKVTTSEGFISRAWEEFFLKLQEMLDRFGIERSAEITNNQGSATDIVGLVFDKTKVSLAIVDFIVQRTTDTNESVSGGSAVLYYKPRANTWEFLVAPVIAGVTLSVTSEGQVKYTSSNISGTVAISRIVWRSKTMAAKHSSYSLAGR